MSLSLSDCLGTASHCLITVGFCLFGFYAFAPAFYIGREVAQSEYRYIEANGGKRANCPWYCGFIPSAWTVKGFLDYFLPCLTALVLWYFGVTVWSIYACLFE